MAQSLACFESLAGQGLPAAQAMAAAGALGDIKLVSLGRVSVFGGWSYSGDASDDAADDGYELRRANVERFSEPSRHSQHPPTQLGGGFVFMRLSRMQVATAPHF